MENKRNRKKIILPVIIGALILVVALLGWRFLISPPETPGWHVDTDGVNYYVLDSGRPAKGYCEIEGTPYYFERGGKPASKGWIEEDYYCEGKGQLATGWKYIDGKVCYFYQKEDQGKELGKRARDYTTAGKIHIPESGYVEGDKGKALAYGIDVLNKNGWTLEDAYKYSSSLTFKRDGNNTYDMKVEKCAIQGFEKGEGNCLAWSGTFTVMAKLLGKDCRLIWGSIKAKDKVYVHGWTEIWEGDDIHVYDPRKNEGDDFTGFDFHYGDKGSYRYDEDNKEYLKW